MFLSLMLTVFCTAQASDDELYDDLIHSDVPLWSASDDNVWPQHFTNEDEFGCVNRSKFGDWRFTDSDGDHMWYRFQNYGVFHCWVNVYEAYERNELETAEHKPSFFVELTNVDSKKVNYDLWAVQIGARHGSDYILLARESEKKMSDNYLVLQRKCSRNNIRSGPNLDILKTDYCSINSKKDF
ncbi:hypothetical protein [Hellea balneolensis]|uniref:hypothetical protein n=1 Tax=Hellea balneolensis TaxID=287478 RepID=UPI00138ACE90|nr:hypothetical protein [Hellea balneolensis]